MTVITDLIKELKTLNIRVLEIIQEEAEREREFINTLNKKQLSRGKRADDTNLPPYAASSKKGGLIKLFDEGDFYAGIDSLFTDEGIEPVGFDDKTTMLVARYGDILGLTDESVNLLVQKILPRVQARVRALFR